MGKLCCFLDNFFLQKNSVEALAEAERDQWGFFPSFFLFQYPEEGFSDACALVKVGLKTKIFFCISDTQAHDTASSSKVGEKILETRVFMMMFVCLVKKQIAFTLASYYFQFEA